jgi:hypothetical protein
MVDFGTSAIFRAMSTGSSLDDVGVTVGGLGLGKVSPLFELAFPPLVWLPLQWLVLPSLLVRLWRQRLR